MEKWPEDGFVGAIDPRRWHTLTRGEDAEWVDNSHPGGGFKDGIERLVRAIRARQVLSGAYLEDDGALTDVRISPHALHEVRGRDMVRVFRHDRNIFTSLAVGRLRNITAGTGAYIDGAEDGEWNTWVDVWVRPRSGLDPRRQAVMSAELGLDYLQDRSLFTCRRCLVDEALRIRGLGCTGEGGECDVEIEMVSDPRNF